MMSSEGESVVSLDAKKKELLVEVEKFGARKILKLRRVNQSWNIGLTVIGITCTTLATVLGVIDVPNYTGWLKVGVTLMGATAVATQTAGREFRIKGKAGDYAEAEASLAILQYKIPKIKDEQILQELENEFFNLQRKVAQIESQDHDE